MNEANVIETDVLVIGGGAAGVWAAIRAKELCGSVTLVDKSRVARSGATTFIHGIMAPPEEENIYPVMKEVVLQGEYMCDQPRLEGILRQHADRIGQMESWGVPFLRDESGRLYTRKGRNHNVNRAIYAPGIGMLEKMREHLLHEGVRLIERVMVTDLLTSDGKHPTQGRIVGAVGFHTRTGERYVFKAKAVALTSGVMSAKLHLVFSDNVTGDGQAMALRAGAEFSGIEFGQQPYFPIWGRKFSGVPPGALQTYGAQPVNRLGENLYEKYFPGREPHMYTRTELGFAMAKETLEGRGPVYLDLSHWSDETVERIRHVLPSDMKAFEEEGIDIRKQTMEAVSVVSVWFANVDGGIRTALDASSSLPGLYAAGACAHEGVNYADSSGVSQAACYSAGYKAGEAAAKSALQIEGVQIDVGQVESLHRQAASPLDKKHGPTSKEVYTAINKVTLPANLCYFKHERRIRETLAEVERVQEEMIPKVMAGDIHELVKANEARNYAAMVEAAYTTSLDRKESRLCHYREEFPYRDDVDWLKWIVIRKDEKGLTTRIEPIPIEDYPVRPSERSRVPAPVQYSS
jgi:succinate dehydrogenase/fumarate reductase flavoprotein subunit